MLSTNGGQETREEQLRNYIAQLKEEVEREKAEKRQIQRDKAKLQNEKAKELEELRDTLGSKFEADIRKMQQEMFELQHELTTLQDKNANLLDGDRNTAAVLREVDKKHRNDIELLHKQHRLALKKQMEELKAMNRKLNGKEKEMAKLTERLTRAEADKDKLQDEIKRLKQAESWTRRSTTPPSLSPSSSMSDLVSKRERDMVMKNSELSFRVRTLEEAISQLKMEKNKLQTKLKESRQQLAPLEQQKLKLGHRINDLNSLLRSREKKIEEMSKNVIELKSSKQQLEEETIRQQKSLQQQMSQSSTHRAEKEKLRSKNLQLSQTNTSLSDELELMKSENKDLQERLTLCSPPVSPSHAPLSPHSSRSLSPTSSFDGDSPLSSSAGSSILLEQLDQLQFDKEESEIKYEEMKTEYVDLRDKYKNLVSKYEELQAKQRDQQAKNKVLRQQLALVKKEHMELEHEVALLHRAGDVNLPHDIKRFDSLHKQLEEKEKRICELEDFIVEQDEVAQKSEEALEKEKKDVQIKLLEISETNQNLSDQMQELRQRVSELEKDLDQANVLLQMKESEIEDLQQRQPVASEPQPCGGENEYEVSGSPLSATQMQRCVNQYKIQINHLDEKNANLQRDFDEAVAQVKELQGLTVELEGRLVESEREHEEVVNNRDEEIDLLNQKLTQLETKIKRMKKSLPVEVDQNELNEVVDRVLEATRRVKVAADERSNTLRSELFTLEEAINDLIHAVLPEYVWPVPHDREMSSSLTSRLQEETELSLRTSEGESILSASSLSTEQVSTDFTDLPQTYNKVNTSEQTSLSASPRYDSFDTRPQLPASYESVDGSLEFPLRISPVDPPLFLGMSHRRAQGVDKSLQTTRTVMKECSSQTQAIKKPTTYDRVTQTSSARSHHQSSQTSYTMRLATADKSAQTWAVTKPVLVNCSTQTRKHTPVEQASHSRIYRLAECSTQTPSTWHNMADFTSPGPHTRSVERNLFQTPPQISDWSQNPTEKSLAHKSLAQNMPFLHHSSSPDDVAWRSPTSLATPNEQSQLIKTVDGLPRVFVAVMDYDPNSLCTSGRPELELSFHTGDVLSVHGDMDENGYYCASFGGESGLVPANFVQEMDVADLTTRERLFNQTLSHNLSTGSPAQRNQHHSPLIHCQLPKEGRCPQSPISFQVEKVVGHNGLLVTWQPPPMDGMCRSNGCLVTGYQLYVNGETKSLVSGSSQSKTLLHGVPAMKTLRLGISTSSIEGKCSKVTEIVYHGRPVSISSTSPEPETLSMYVALNDYNPTKSSPSENPEFELPFKEGDLIKVHGKEKDGFLVGELRGKHGLVPAAFVTQVSRPQEKAQSPSKSLGSSPGLLISSRRMFALYDYDPISMSPNPNPEAELGFKAGDMITVYGNMHGDGFYSGELDGRFGLVPSNFLQELKQSVDDPRNKVKGQTRHN